MAHRGVLHSNEYDADHGPMLLGSQEPAKGKGGPTGVFAGAAAMLQLRLLDMYLALENAAAFASAHEALSKLCARAIRAAAVALPGTSTSNAALSAGVLRPLLDRQVRKG